MDKAVETILNYTLAGDSSRLSARGLSRCFFGGDRTDRLLDIDLYINIFRSSRNYDQKEKTRILVMHKQSVLSIVEGHGILWIKSTQKKDRTDRS